MLSDAEANLSAGFGMPVTQSGRRPAGRRRRADRGCGLRVPGPRDPRSQPGLGRLHRRGVRPAVRLRRRRPVRGFGRPAGLARRQLPPAPRRDSSEALHASRRGAGLPGTRPRHHDRGGAADQPLRRRTRGPARAVMNVWAISDLHLSFGRPDRRDRFGGRWRDHAAKIERGWREAVRPDDVVLLPGDLSMARNHREVQPDLEWLGALPGTKVLSPGNHERWWNDTDAVRRLLRRSMIAVGGDAAEVRHLIVCGTRGAPVLGDDPAEADRIAAERELGLLERALDHALRLREAGEVAGRSWSSGTIPPSMPAAGRGHASSGSNAPGSPPASTATCIFRPNGRWPSRESSGASGITVSPPMPSASDPSGSEHSPTQIPPGPEGHSLWEAMPAPRHPGSLVGMFRSLRIANMTSPFFKGAGKGAIRVTFLCSADMRIEWVSMDCK